MLYIADGARCRRLGLATTQDPDYDSPWQDQVPQLSTATSEAVGPGQILTCAHVVANATFVQISTTNEVE